MSVSKQFEQYLETIPDQVVKNTKVITPEVAGIDYMLHMSTNTNIRKFIPRIGDRQMQEEDRTIPRICTAPHILGCLIGYNKSSRDFGKKADGKTDDGWAGGWKIYAFDFDYCLRPNKQMVPDARISDEHWLVTHNADTVEYVPRTAGKMFMRRIVLTARSHDYPQEDIECYLEVIQEQGILFTKDRLLKPGYYRIQGPNYWMLKDWKDAEGFQIDEISKESYIENKRACADLLSLAPQIPAGLKW